MSDKKADPKILQRLNDMPPYLDQKGNAVEEKPKEEIETPVEEIKEEEPTEEVEETTEEVVENKEEDEVTEEKALENSKNPERTKEYIDKIKSENEALRQQAKKADEMLQTPQFEYQPPELPKFENSPVTNEIPKQQEYPHLTQNEIKDQFKSIVDDQGYVDTGLLTEVLTTAENRARQAEERARRAEQGVTELSRRYDNDKIEVTKRRVYEKYPQLDPDRTDIKFDGRLWEFARNEMVSQQIQGKPLDYLSAVEKGYDILYPNQMTKKEKQTINNLKQINATGTKVSTTQRVTEAPKGYITKKGQLKDRLSASGY